MALIKKKTPEQRAEEDALREQRRRDEEERARIEGIEKARQEFLRTPAGRARAAFERGDHLFQFESDVMSQQAVIVPMFGSAAPQKTDDPVRILNSVCYEGWDLVNGSFVFVEHGQQSRDKFMSSGQNVAISGTTVGYYLFRRCVTKKREMSNPWEAANGSEADTHAKNSFQIELLSRRKQTRQQPRASIASCISARRS